VVECGNDHQEFSRVDLRTALDLVYEAIENLNPLRSPDNPVSLRPNVVLMGESGCLDSLELITLVLAIERRVLELTGRGVSLLDGLDIESQLRALHNPSSLADLIVARCEE
jgi:hypothetical protein